MSRVLRLLLKTPNIGYLENYVRIIAAPVICGQPLVRIGRPYDILKPSINIVVSYRDRFQSASMQLFREHNTFWDTHRSQSFSGAAPNTLFMAKWQRHVTAPPSSSCKR